MDILERLAELERRPANIRAAEIRSLLEAAGFTARHGKHQWLFTRAGMGRPIIVPEHKGKAIPKIAAIKILRQIRRELERS